MGYYLQSWGERARFSLSVFATEIILGLIHIMMSQILFTTLLHQIQTTVHNEISTKWYVSLSLNPQ